MILPFSTSVDNPARLNIRLSFGFVSDSVFDNLDNFGKFDNPGDL